jgi:hypothetical protein
MFQRLSPIIIVRTHQNVAAISRSFVSFDLRSDFRNGSKTEVTCFLGKSVLPSISDIDHGWRLSQRGS